MKIVADANIPAVEQYFAPFGQVTRVEGRSLQAAQLRAADILLVRSVTRVDAALLAGSAVRFVGTATSGLDHIDRDYLAAAGIGFAGAPGANANSVVEYVLAAIAAVDGQLERLLTGGTVGIVGCGAVGRTLAGRLDALGVGYCISDPWLDQGSVPHAAPLEAVLTADVITLHCELTRRSPYPSYRLLAATELDRLGTGQLLINASRGEVIDEAALLARLSGEQPPVVVLDVWDGEPAIDMRLLDRLRLGTAHIAGYSLDGKLAATRMLRDALQSYLDTPSAAHSPGPDSALSLQAPEDLSGADLVRHLVSRVYDIARDDRKLRDTARANDPAAAFDGLRRQYRERRELAGSRVRIAAGTPEQAATIAALGCVAEFGVAQ
jgi:erythronate-4-phosphate dehydrogenase